MATYAQQMQELVRRFQEAHDGVTFQAKDVAAWAIRERLWEANASAVLNRCAEDISRAMREEYIVDAKGRHVRVKHAVTLVRDGKQFTLWADMRSAPRKHMDMAFRQRRQQILGDCRQLKNDVDSYNESLNPGELIQLIFDFNLDLEELDLARAA